jgi:hypothetical protein
MRNERPARAGAYLPQPRAGLSIWRALRETVTGELEAQGILPEDPKVGVVHLVQGTSQKDR